MTAYECPSADTAKNFLVVKRYAAFMNAGEEYLRRYSSTSTLICSALTLSNTPGRRGMFSYDSGPNRT